MTLIDDSRPRQPGKPLPDDIVRVVFKGWKNEDPDRNVNDDFIVVGWDSRNYRLDRDQPGFIPAAAAYNSFGDPRSGASIATDRDARGLVGFIPDRATEVRRLRMRYANNFGSDEEFQTAPIVEVYDLDNNRVTTVLDDPTGETVTPAPVTVASHEYLLNVIAKQQADLSRLLKLAGLDDRAAGVAEPVTPADLGIEEPFTDDAEVDDLTEPDDGGDGSEVPEDTGGQNYPPPVS